MFKAMTQKELETFNLSLGELRGARLQEVRTSAQVLSLGFFHHGDLIWAFFDLTPARPYACLLNYFPEVIRGKKTPLLLFLKAHMVGHRLGEAQILSEVGRVLELKLGHCQLEIRLIPHATNAIARSENQKISWSKMAPLGPAQAGEGQDAVASVGDRVASWLDVMAGNSGRGTARLRDPAKALEKKRTAKQQLQKRTERPESGRWQELGELIKERQEVPKDHEFSHLLEAGRSLAEKIQMAFQNAEKSEQKEMGAAERLKKLEEEIKSLEAGKDLAEGHQSEGSTSEGSKEGVLWDESTRGKRIPLGEGLELYVGRSAKDNLSLLRKANAWDLWLHLKDYPGAHGIIHRNRKQEISDTHIRQALQYVAAQSAGKYLSEGDRFDGLAAEVRFVRPIKGDKLGRVTFRNERVFTLKYAAQR